MTVNAKILLGTWNRIFHIYEYLLTPAFELIGGIIRNESGPPSLQVQATKTVPTIHKPEESVGAAERSEGERGEPGVNKWGGR